MPMADQNVKEATYSDDLVMFFTNKRNAFAVRGAYDAVKMRNVYYSGESCIMF